MAVEFMIYLYESLVRARIEHASPRSAVRHLTDCNAVVDSLFNLLIHCLLLLLVFVRGWDSVSGPCLLCST